MRCPTCNQPTRESPAGRDALILDHLAMADAVARRYHARSQDWGDMRQVAYLGLIKAACRFDPERGNDFASFAVPTIAGELKRHLRDNGWAVRPPRSMQELHHAVTLELPRLTQRLGHDPSTEEIADALGENPGRVLEASECAMRPLSLDAPGRGMDDSEALADQLATLSPEWARADLAMTLHHACLGLTERERRIVFLRFFRDQTQSQIAESLGVTQMQVSRLLTRILGRLRDALGGNHAAA